MLGDRGVNLSGGQKTRVNLARCFYADRDVYLLDDPISALDVHVGKQVMEDGVLGLLKGKTRIVATHALAYLPYFDRVVVLDEGRVVAQGTYDQIIQEDAFLQLKATLEQEELKRKASSDHAAPEDATVSQVNDNEAVKTLTLEKKLSEKKGLPKTKADAAIEGIVSAEDKSRGRVVTFAVLKAYCSYLGGKRIIFLAFLCKLI